jgi:hypothetical protein
MSSFTPSRDADRRSFINLSAKRCRDRGLTPPLGLAIPRRLRACRRRAFLQPRVAEVMSRWYVWGVDALFVAAALWTIYELGWRRVAHVCFTPLRRRSAGGACQEE